MTVPKSLKKAAKAADDKHKALYEKPAPEDTETSTKDSAPAEPTQSKDTDVSQSTPQADEPRQGDSDSTEAISPGDGVDYKNQYLSLKGKYDAEIPRMAQELRAVKSEKAELEKRLSALEQAKEQAQDTAQPMSKEVIERLENEFGQDFAQLIMDVVRAELKGQQTPIIDELEALRKTQKESAEQRFMQELAQLVPEWRQINVDAQFHAWLAQTDPLSGRTRQELLDAAGQSLDAQRVSAIFSAFKATQGAPSAKASAAQPKSVSPARSTAADPAPAKPAYSIKDWQQLQDDYRRGRYRGREDEFRRKEAEIHAALFAA